MIVKTFKEMIANIPNEYNNFDIIFAETFNIESDRNVWGRKDSEIAGIISDSENNEMMLVSEDSYQKISSETNLE